MLNVRTDKLVSELRWQVTNSGHSSTTIRLLRSFLLIGLAQARLWSNTAFRRRVFTAEFAILAAVEPHPSIPIAAIQGFSDPFSSITHLLGAGFFLVLGIVLLIRQRVGLGEAIAVLIFVLGVVFMLTMSGVFHLLTPGTASRAVLQRLDHASIFFLIAATFSLFQYEMSLKEGRISNMK